MAVGFLCRDGVVIGADTQVTGANYTFPECKLINFEWKNGSGILAYSGDRDTFVAFSAELRSRLPDDANLTDQEIRNVLKECLAVSVEKKKAFLTIMGYWIDGERFPCLVMSTTTQRIIDVADCEVIGYADSPLARSCLGRFRALSHRVSVQQARLFAVDFISQAKNYDGQYVGGNIDLYSISDDPRIPSVDGSAIVREGKYTHLITSGTDEWERELERIKLAFDLSFCSLIDLDEEPSLSHLTGSAKSFRFWLTGKSTHGDHS
ncbi:hypothetical protein SBA7_1310009 [Candidatus Sulfotelmatobacter sp. SbA7]|nr:hypothetical protein SBA7_1310009 [Candidatus Sulfotelmatobacter sp. SbA7]